MPDEKDWSWFALQVKPQKERTAAVMLRNKGYEEFLPMYKRRRLWSDRIKEVHFPLFPGYVFCRFSLQNRLPVLTTPGVLRVIGAGKVPLPVEDSEVGRVRAVVDSTLKAEPWPFLKVGKTVRIGAGPLRGTDGILLRSKGPCRLIVSVTLLQRSIAVEIDGAWISDRI